MRIRSDLEWYRSAGTGCGADVSLFLDRLYALSDDIECLPMKAGAIARSQYHSVPLSYIIASFGVGGCTHNLSSFPSSCLAACQKFALRGVTLQYS